MSKTFKPGDRIRLTRKYGLNAPEGATATVGRRGLHMGEFGGPYVDVIWDREYRQNNGGYWPDDFELMGTCEGTTVSVSVPAGMKIASITFVPIS